MPPAKPPLAEQRLDKWLWAARFFKTRKLATEAINGGKVHVSGQRSKPGKTIQVGTRIEIHKNHYRWYLTVTALNAQRRPASEATFLYEEDPESFKARQEAVALQRDLKASTPVSDRPNKKQRRAIHRMKSDY